MWIYHKSETPKTIQSDEQEAYKAKGWSDTPATFLDVKDFGVNPDDSLAVHTLGENIEAVKNAANGAINIDIMDKKQLEKYADINFNVNLDRRKGVKTLRKQVNELINDNG